MTHRGHLGAELMPAWERVIGRAGSRRRATQRKRSLSSPHPSRVLRSHRDGSASESPLSHPSDLARSPSLDCGLGWLQDLRCDA